MALFCCGDAELIGFLLVDFFQQAGAVDEIQRAKLQVFAEAYASAYQKLKVMIQGDGLSKVKDTVKSMVGQAR